jgi:hypothetical protein
MMTDVEMTEVAAQIARADCFRLGKVCRGLASFIGLTTPRNLGFTHADKEQAVGRFQGPFDLITLDI